MQFLVIKSLVMHWLPTGQCPVSGDWNMLKSIGLSEVGKLYPSKTDEFSEKFQRGGGSFSIQKFMLQIFALYEGLFLGVFRKKIAT